MSVKRFMFLGAGYIRLFMRTMFGIEHLYNFAMSYSHIEEMAVEYAVALDEAEMLIERLGSKFPKERIYRSRVSPVIGTHTGPSLLVVTVLGDR